MTVGASGPEACDDASGALPGGWRDRGSVRRHVRGATTTRDVGNADDAPHLRQPDHGRRLVGSWPDPRRRRLLLGALHVRMAARAAGRAQPRPGQLAVHRPRIHLASQAASRRYAPRHLGQRDGLESQHETVPDLRAVARWRELRLLRRSSRRPLQGEEPRPEHGHRSGILRRRGWAALLAHESCPPPRTGTRRPRDQARRDADRSVACTSSSKGPTSSSTAATTTCCSRMAARCHTSRARSARCARRHSKGRGKRIRATR